METKRKTLFKHRIYYQFIAAVVLIVLIMLGITVYLTYHMQMQTSADVSLFSELILEEILVGVGVMVAAVFAVIMVVRRVVKPVEALSIALHHLADGDFQTVLEYQSNNELGQLAREFNLLRETLFRQYIKKPNGSQASGVKAFTAGTKVFVYYDSEIPCKTLVRRVTEDGKIHIFPLMRKGETFESVKGQKLKCYFAREGERHSIIAEVDDVAFVESEKLVILEPLSEPTSAQRRRNFRVSVDCGALLRRVGNGAFPADQSYEPEHTDRATLLNLSMGGALIHTQSNYREGERLYLRLFLTMPGIMVEQLDLIVKVTRYEQEAFGKGNTYGVMLIDIAAEASNILSSFIMFKQQEQSKKRVSITDSRHKDGLSEVRRAG